MNAIETHDLSKAYGPTWVVEGLELTVPAGIVFGYLGPNGAGKTTTIRMLTGVLAPSRGSGTVAGESLRQPDRVKARIGYANQAVSVYPDLTVRENLEFKASLYLPHREVRVAVDRVLDALALRDRATLLGAQLSGGWRQRLSIGNAIIHAPSVLFLDEPTAGLDPVGRRDLWDAIYALTAEGTTVFVTTHYMDEAERCHRLAMISRGKVLAEGTPEALRSETPGHFYELEASDLALTLASARALDDVRDAWIAGASLRIAARAELPSAELARLGAARTVTPTLEDVFVALAEKERTL